jgi:mRNA interferase MazF
VTSNIARVFPFQVLLPAEHCGLEADSKAQAEEVRSVDVSRVGRRVGLVVGESLDALDDALRLHLSL